MLIKINVCLLKEKTNKFNRLHVGTYTLTSRERRKLKYLQT